MTKSFAEYVKENGTVADLMTAHMDGMISCPFTGKDCNDDGSSCYMCSVNPKAEAVERAMIETLENHHLEEMTQIEAVVSQGMKTTKAVLLRTLEISFQKIKDAEEVIHMDDIRIHELEMQLAEKIALVAPAPVVKDISDAVEYKCECGKVVTKAVAAYSNRNMGKTLCLACQKEFKKVDHVAPEVVTCTNPACGKELSIAEISYCNRKFEGKMMCKSCQKVWKEYLDKKAAREAAATVTE